MNLPRSIPSVALLCAIFAVPAFGISATGVSEASGTDVRPLVRIVDDFTLNPQPPPALAYEQFTFVSRSGYVSYQGSITASGGSPDGAVGRGIASPEERIAIRDLLTRGQIGLQRDCVEVTASRVGHREITWWGQNGRRNEFRYVFAPDLSSGLPACAPRVAEMLEDLDYLTGTIVVKGELLVTPPTP
ncbi:MAG TPA: hypothetical protein VN851_04140 [Thermoanaerobaculia bacterium]|nr:hypothetical protein [Thermoanaerobaculia bacterium]